MWTETRAWVLAVEAGQVRKHTSIVGGEEDGLRHGLAVCFVRDGTIAGLTEVATDKKRGGREASSLSLVLV